MARILFGPLLLSAAATLAVGQGGVDAGRRVQEPLRQESQCVSIVTTRDAARCIGAVHADEAVPTVDPEHAYSLEELVDIAEAASPEGRIAWAEAKRSLEAAGVVRAQYLPLLILVAQSSDSRSISPFPKPLAPRGYVTAEDPTLTAQLQVQYSLLDLSRGPKLDASRALELASTLRLSRTQQILAYNVAAQFYDAHEAVGRLSAAETVLLTAETLDQDAQSQFDNGRATLPDVQNAHAGVAEAQYDLTSAQAGVKKSILALSESIGIEPTVELHIQVHNGPAPQMLDGSIDDLLQTAWKSRPDLLARAQDLRGARAMYRAARSAYLPKIDVNGSGGQTKTWPSADFGELGTANVSTWSTNATLRWEVFNGARRDEVGVALAEQKSAAEQQRAAHDSVTRQVWDAYVDYQTAIEQSRSSQSFLAAAETSYDSSLDAYTYGVRSLVDVVQAEKQLAQARFAVVQSNAKLMKSAVALSFATGDIRVASGSPSGVHP